jgi:hypothetical protein
MVIEVGTPIVARALELAALHPKMAAIHILDAAMQGHHGQTIDFRRRVPDASYSDWLDPPSEFAELLHRAFGAHLEPQDVDWQSPAWEFDVIEAFAERYDVIPVGITEDTSATITHDGPLRRRAPAATTGRSTPPYSSSGALMR